MALHPDEAHLINTKVWQLCRAHSQGDYPGAMAVFRQVVWAATAFLGKSVGKSITKSVAKAQRSGKSSPGATPRDHMDTVLEVTPQEAADYLGVSRPTLVRLLDAGEIPMSRPGRHRYVRLVDLMAYAERVRQTRSDELDEMARDAETAGLYDVLDGPPPAMR